MPVMHLTDLSVRALKSSAQYVSYMDDTTRGFGIRVGKTRKTWVCVRGRSRERITIGHYPAMSLADARTEAKRLLAEANGTAPVPPKTFKDARDEFLEDNYRDSKSRWKHIVKLTFAKHFKALDHKQLADITDADIRKVLDRMAHTPSAQLHAYRVLRTFLKWGTRPPRRYLTHSPMEGYAPPGKDRKGSRILTDDELKAVWKAAEGGSRAVFRLLVLWGTRNAETACIEREWVKDGVLTIPGSATKNGRDHSIPILPLAKGILDDRPEAGQYYFPGRYSDEDSLTAGGLNHLKREIQNDSGTSGWQIRDIRRTFRSNMARLGVPREICEVLINHAPPILDEIYDRYDRIQEKREALAKYEDFMVKLLRSGKP